MAMTTCKECKAQISTTAESCPHCGAKRRKTSGCAMVAAAFFGLVFVLAIARGCAGDTTPQISNSPSTASHPPTASAKVSTDPASVLTEAKQTVDEIQTRYENNAKQLKKYYVTTDQVKESASDTIRLAAVAGLYKNSKQRDERELSKRAYSLAQNVIQQQRLLYASAMEQVLVKNGMDVNVSAIGKDNDELRLKYALMSKPLVYKFQNEMDLQNQAKQMGFNKIIYTDGYNETWRVDLNSK